MNNFFADKRGGTCEAIDSWGFNPSGERGATLRSLIVQRVTRLSVSCIGPRNLS